MNTWSRYLTFLSLLSISWLSAAQYNFNVIHSMGETNHQIISAAFSNDGSFIITTGADSSIIIWNAERRTIYRTIIGLAGKPNIAITSPDNRFLVSGGNDKVVTKWDLSTVPPKVNGTFGGFSGPVKAVALSPDGRYLATGSTGGGIRIWDIINASVIFDLKAPEKNKDINSVTFSPDGSILASGGADGKVVLWNTANGLLTGIESGQKGIYRVAFSPDGKFLACCGYGNDIIVWQMPGFRNKVVLKGHKDWVHAIDFAPDSKSLISGGRDRYIILWDAPSGKMLGKSDKQPGIVMNLDFNPAGPGFLSANLASELIEKWALSGITYTGTAGTKVKTADLQVKPDKVSVISGKEKVASMIEIFSPDISAEQIISNTGNIKIVGRVYDPEDISVVLINRTPVPVSEAGIFDFSLPLTKGENIVGIVAINTKGSMNERILTVNCTAEDALTGQTAGPSGKYHALLIGINDYESSEISDLDNPINDAQKLYDVLSSRYTFNKENIIFLKNPRLRDIIIALEDMSRNLTEKDNLLIFFAGHGLWDEKNKLGYWLPADADRGSSVNWVRNSALRDLISSNPAKHILLIADACFSGAIFKSRDAGSAEAITRLNQLTSRKAMTSGVLEKVPDESVFLKYLLKKLYENENKYFTSEMLFTSLKMTVMDNSSNVPQFGVIQNVGDDGGDFIFIRK